MIQTRKSWFKCLCKATFNNIYQWYVNKRVEIVYINLYYESQNQHFAPQVTAFVHDTSNHRPVLQLSLVLHKFNTWYEIGKFSCTQSVKFFWLWMVYIMNKTLEVIFQLPNFRNRPRPFSRCASSLIFQIPFYNHMWHKSGWVQMVINNILLILPIG